MTMTDTKTCPFCAEEVEAEAGTCAHCGKWIECRCCGREVNPNGKFCPQCGNSLKSHAVDSRQVDETLSIAPASMDFLVPTLDTETSPLERPFDLSTGATIIHYAGFGRKLAALVLDALILAIPVALVAPFTARTGGIAIVWLYTALMMSSGKQATLGMMALGIIATDLEGNKIGFGKATTRYFASIVSSLFLCAGYLISLRSGRKQTLHDRLAGTLIVRRSRV